MKTRNAFALRNFDEKRILQQPRFKWLKLPHGTDDDILNYLDVSTITDLGECEERIAHGFFVKESVSSFAKKISRHVKRGVNVLTRMILHKFDAERIKRFNEILDQYSKALDALKNLFDRLVRLARSNEKIAQWIYRRRFAKNLKTAREKAGITQKQVALMLGSNVPTISDYERGEVAPSFRNLARLSNILKVSIDSLIKQ